ncbi:MAG: alanine racemase [Acidobacteriota bacterium]|nr:alanine racemase [Acidobacteriota bacterium]
MPQDARCYVEISRPRIAANYRAVRDAVGPSTGIIAVVKANAYGHGAVEVAHVLAAEGAEWLAVSCVEEGVSLRRSGIECRLLVMAGVMNWEQDALREFRLTPVAHSLDDLRRFDEGRPIDVHLKIDTGMHRMGTLRGAAEIAETISGLRSARVEGLLSHFASPADFTSSQTEDQIREFGAMQQALAGFGVRPALTHFAGTNAIAYPRRVVHAEPVHTEHAALSLVRPGHAIYGYVSPARGHAPAPCIQVAPALSWHARILEVKDIPAGAKVGYGGSFTAAAPMRIAVLAAGYADGVPHRLSNKGKVIAGGRFAPIVGTVSMDLTTIDITHSPHLRPGDEATLLGREGDASLDAQQIARAAGTISYNVLCGISARVKRFYTDLIP